MHPANTTYQNPIVKPTPPVFNATLVNEFVSRIKKLHEEGPGKNGANLKINLPSTKAICMGFSITAS